MSRMILTLDDEKIGDLSPMAALVVRAGSTNYTRRADGLVRGLAMLAYALCDIADALRSPATDE